MLYEVITLWSGNGVKENKNLTGLGGDLALADGFTPVFSKVLTRENSQGDFTKNDPKPVSVIASYSIHYTKLYDRI